MNNIEWGKRIKTYIAKNGITQKQLATMSGIEYTVLSRMLNGKLNFSYNTAKKVEAAINYNQNEPGTNTDINIHKLIDDAMVKKDRIVNIYISESGITVTVSPMVEKEKE